MFNDHIVLTQDGKHVLVANFYSDDVVGIDVETMKEAFRIKDCSAPHVVKYGPLKKHAYVTCKKITGIAIIDPADRKLVKFIQMNVNPRSLTFSPDETKVYFGSFWVNGFFEMDVESGKVTRLFAFDPPTGDTAPQEVTYHGVEAVRPNIVLAANEGRSYVDCVDVKDGKLLDRLTDVSKPCCVERIPGPDSGPVRVLVSNIGDGTLQLVEVTEDGKLKSLGKAPVGKAPKRVAFLPARSEPCPNQLDHPGETIMNLLSRRNFLFASSGAAAGSLLVPGLCGSRRPSTPPERPGHRQPQAAAAQGIPGFLSAEQIAPHHTAHYGGALKAFVGIERSSRRASRRAPSSTRPRSSDAEGQVEPGQQRHPARSCTSTGWP